MDFVLNFFTSISWETIAQLTMVSLIMIAGPVVIFLLAAKGGDL